MIKNNAQKISFGGLMLALSLVFGYVEYLLPLDFIAPGVKIGLANCVFMCCTVCIGFIPALGINISRILLSSLLFGSPVSLIFSLSGAALSMTVTYVLCKLKFFSLSGVGAASGIAHNLGQLIAAALVTGTVGVFLYAPVLLVSGVFFGYVTGGVSQTISKRLK